MFKTSETRIYYQEKEFWNYLGTPCRRTMVDCRNKSCIGRRILQSEGRGDYGKLDWHHKTGFSRNRPVLRGSKRALHWRRRLAPMCGPMCLRHGWTKDKGPKLQGEKEMPVLPHNRTCIEWCACTYQERPVRCDEEYFSSVAVTRSMASRCKTASCPADMLLVSRRCALRLSALSETLERWLLAKLCHLMRAARVCFLLSCTQQFVQSAGAHRSLAASIRQLSFKT